MNYLLLPVLLYVGLSAAQNVACPTVTTHSVCPTCPVPACASVSTIHVPCGCSGPIPTQAIIHPCDEPCYSLACAYTSYVTASEACGILSGCPTITSTVRAPDCTPPPLPGQSTCAEQACGRLVDVNVPCSCGTNAIPTTTVTGPCTCRVGCETFSQAVYQPCPTVTPLV